MRTHKMGYTHRRTRSYTAYLVRLPQRSCLPAIPFVQSPAGAAGGHGEQSSAAYPVDVHRLLVMNPYCCKDLPKTRIAIRPQY